MDTSTLPKVLCVDDESQVLAGLSLNLRRRYDVMTAPGGQAGLDLLRSTEGVAVVMSDMRMPGMDGAAFLSKARALVPDTVRILLTGHSDMDSAIAAINEGQIFRFLTKPCPVATLIATVQAAVEHHRLITAEKVLLEQTVRGSIKALTDVLALTSPMAFGRASRIKTRVSELAAQLEIVDRWQVEVAAMLSQLGYIVLPPETLQKVYFNQELTEEETEMVARVPAVTEQLLGSIPRLEAVRDILGQYTKPFHPLDPTKAADAEARLVHQGAQVLRVAVSFEAFESKEGSAASAFEAMQSQEAGYDPAVLEALQAVTGTENARPVREIRLADLQVGMVFAQDVKTDTGTLFVARGFQVTPGMVERVANIRRGAIKEPFRVIIP